MTAGKGFGIGTQTLPEAVSKEKKDLDEVVGDIDALGANPRNPRNRF